MAGRYLYYVSSDANKMVCFDESDYYDSLNAMDADYVKNMNEAESKEPIKYLENVLSDLGAAIGYSREIRDAGFAYSFRFEDVEKMKEQYFKPKLEKLKKEAENLTLYELIRQAPDLNRIINDPYDNMVTLWDVVCETTLTMDSFIRETEPKTAYYVYKNVILIHF